jgi:hypothetical protein
MWVPRGSHLNSKGAFDVGLLGRPPPPSCSGRSAPSYCSCLMCSIAFHCFQPSPPHANRRLSPAPHRTLDPSIFTEPGARRSLAGRFGGGGGRFRWPWRAPTRSEISSALLLFFSSAKSFTYICCLPPLSSIPLRLQLCYVRVE